MNARRPGATGFGRRYRTPPAPGFQRRSGAEPQPHDRETINRRLLCRHCRHPITDGTQAVVPGGAHRHTFFNPQGLVFEIGCFRQAPGCTVHGEPTDHFSWFAGHHWQLALCDRCRQHLGWCFRRAGEAGFFGLILNQLSEEN